MRGHDETWVIIPAFNEGAMIARTVSEVLERFDHVVCIDDGSRDDTARCALAAGAHLIEHPINLGQGAALQTGFDWVLECTAAEWIITFDADGQHLPEDAEAMIELGRSEDLAFVLGSRFLGTEATGLGLARRLVLKTVARVSSSRTGLRLSDAHNGLRAIRRDALESVSLTHNRMAHASEIVAQLAQTGLPWSEMPVTIRYSEYSKAKGQSLLNSVNILVDLMLE